MVRSGPFAALRQIRDTLLTRENRLTDARLVAEFVDRRDQAAFTALVQRHGPMVLNVCRRLLCDPNDAEDAFQATFLVLMRKAPSLRRRELLANWLYGVAYRTALHARSVARRQRAKETEAALYASAASPNDKWSELRIHLDHEISRLPDKYRLAVVLCELQGLSRRQAASQLRVLEGTLSSRLARARRILAARLARHCPDLATGAVAAVLMPQTTSAAVPPILLSGTTKMVQAAITGGSSVYAISANVTSIMEGALNAMLLTRVRTFFAAAITAVCTTVVTCWCLLPAAAQHQPGQAAVSSGVGAPRSPEQGAPQPGADEKRPQEPDPEILRADMRLAEAVAQAAEVRQKLAGAQLLVARAAQQKIRLELRKEPDQKKRESREKDAKAAVEAAEAEVEVTTIQAEAAQERAQELGRQYEQVLIQRRNGR
jgi:RNA polymerase sigma factor (sigma-70 family)